MVLKVLRRVRSPNAATAMEIHAIWRKARRKEIRIRHDDGKMSLCEKGWMWRFTQRSWNLGPAVARIIAGAVEIELFKTDLTIISRQHVIERVNAQVASFGLADAVPIESVAGAER